LADLFWSAGIVGASLRAPLDRFDLRAALNVARVCRYGHIRYAKKMFSNDVGYFQTVEMLRTSLRQQTLHSSPKVFCPPMPEPPLLTHQP